jgi:hypothetical protein
MNYFKHCREVTIEISNTKILPTSSLINNFNYNVRSQLNYMEEALHGIRGIIKDSCSGLPIRAKVFITGHDFDSSQVYSALPVGNYHRPIYQGTYNVTFSATGYQSKTVTGISVTNGNATVVNVFLKPTVTPAVFSSISSLNTVICQGDNAVFNAAVINGGSSPLYQWQVNGSNAGSNSSIFSSSTLNNGDVVSCIITSSDICATGNPATSNSLTVTVHPLPPAPVIIQAGSSLSSSAAIGNQWYNSSAGIISGATGTVFTPTASGNYFVIVTDGNGCHSDSSNVISFIYNSVNEITPEMISVYPNPSNGDFTIDFNSSINKNTTVEIVDVLGNLRFREPITGRSNAINSGIFESGMYFIKVSGEETFLIRKIIIDKK